MILTSSHQKRQRLLKAAGSQVSDFKLRTRTELNRDKVPSGFGAVSISDFPVKETPSLDVFFPNGVHMSLKGTSDIKEIIELINSGR